MNWCIRTAINLLSCSRELRSVEILSTRVRRGGYTLTGDVLRLCALFENELGTWALFDRFRSKPKIPYCMKSTHPGLDCIRLLTEGVTQVEKQACSEELEREV